MPSEIEIPFAWTCPKCEHRQTDTVNPELGPFLNVTCGECGATTEQHELAPIDAAAWDRAIEEAEQQERLPGGFQNFLGLDSL